MELIKDLKFEKKKNTKDNIIIAKNIDKIINLRNQGLSLFKISREIGVGRKSIEKLFRKNNIQISRGYALHKAHEDYFRKIDTEEKAYLLGFIYADGNNFYKKNRLCIELSIVDEEILQKFANILFVDNEYNHLKYRIVKRNDKEFKYASLFIHNEHISKDLMNLGVVERKSMILTFPKWLDKNLYQHFIRGLIDGDGWIYLPTNNRFSPNVGLIATTEINTHIANFIEKELGLKSYLCKAHKQDPAVMCEIRIKNFRQSKIFLDWLYKDATIFLQRKHNIYLEFLNRYNNIQASCK